MDKPSKQRFRGIRIRSDTKEIDMKRRIFLQGLGLSTIATRGYTGNADAAARFTHGVASGDPLSDRVILWTRVIPQIANDALKDFWQVAICL